MSRSSPAAAPGSGVCRGTAHFILLQHGSHGVARDMAIAEAVLQRMGQSDPSLRLTTFRPTSNSFLLTDAGTRRCAERLLAEFTPVFTEWLDANATQTRLLSCAGHSFGGVILREFLHLLLFCSPLAERVAQEVVFANLVTIATPHCGVVCSVSPLLRSGALLLGKLYSPTYLELILHTDLMHTTLIDEEHIVILRRFKTRTLFANVRHDNLVSFMTASLIYDAEEQRRALQVLRLPPSISPGREEDARKGTSSHADPADEAYAPPSRESEKVITGRNFRILPPLTLGPAPRSTAEDLSAAVPRCEKLGRKIAAALREGLEWRVFPVHHDGPLPTAHATIVKNVLCFGAMMEVLECVARVLLDVS